MGVDVGQLIGQLAIYLVVLMFAFSAHEAAHAWMSYKFGDDTAYLLGRITLNPAAHLDPIGSLLIPIVGFITSNFGVFVPLIGWAKPTPVNPLRWRNKRTANIMVSLAGIMVNLLIAIIALVIFKICQKTGIATLPVMENSSTMIPIVMLLIQTISMNVGLAFFNLLPIPPLDGSHVVEEFLPPSMHDTWKQLEQFSFIILIGLMYFGIIGMLFTPVQSILIILLLL